MDLDGLNNYELPSVCYTLCCSCKTILKKLFLNYFLQCVVVLINEVSGRGPNILTGVTVFLGSSKQMLRASLIFVTDITSLF
jgi:hypothetical protein